MEAFVIQTGRALPSRHLMTPVELRSRDNGTFEYRCAVFDIRTVFPTDEEFDQTCQEFNALSDRPLIASLFRILGDAEGESPGSWIVPVDTDGLLLRSS